MGIATEEMNSYFFFLLLITCRSFLRRSGDSSSVWGLCLASSSLLDFWVAPGKFFGVRELPGREERQRHRLEAGSRPHARSSPAADKLRWAEGSR